MWKDVLELEEAVSGLMKVTTTCPQSTPVVHLRVKFSVLSVGEVDSGAVSSQPHRFVLDSSWG